jgi:MurNAc alpha-1-phosphate uridylyltransferase
MNDLSDTAMILAAGLGTRMRPLTLTTPKPLLVVGGRTMLDHALDRLVKADIKRAVVNVFYLAEHIEEHLRQRTDIEIIISHEESLLDTGGGIKNALHHFGGKPFLAINADLPWIDATPPSLPAMMKTWNAALMDVLLLLMPTDKAYGFSSRGDFIMERDGRLHRHDTHPPYPFVMTAAQIVNPAMYADIRENVFSNNVVWDLAESAQRLYGIEHRGTCYHVGTPEDLAKANNLLANGRGWGVITP